MQRRQFMQGSAASLFAGGSASAEPQKVRAAMLGTGHSHFAGKLKALLESPSYEVVSIAENNADARAKLQRDPRVAGIRFVSEEELLYDKSVQMIVVECRAWEAVPWGAKVISAGKHLHLEKPPGNDYGAFRELVEDARRRKLLLQTGYLWRWHEGVSAAIEAARKGWLGEVFMIRGAINSDRGPEERAIEGRYKGGGMFELGGHLIDRVVDLMGRPTAVRSWLRHDTSEKDRLADNNLAVLEYPKSLAVISQAAKAAGAGPQRSFELIGTDGSFLVYPEANPPVMHVFMRRAQGPYKAGMQVVNLPPQARFVPDFAHLARAIQSGTPLEHSYDHELLLQETLLRVSGEMS